MFEQSSTESNIKVKEAVKSFRDRQKKTKMFKLWKDKSSSKTPRDWSYLNKIPILCCVNKDEFQEAKNVFEILNRGIDKEDEIESAIKFLETTSLFENISNKEKLNEIFKNDIIGEYQALLTNTDEVLEALDRLNIDPYEWRESPIVESKIKELAEAEYKSGGSDKALSMIDNMDDSKLKEYLKLLVKDNIRVGIEILADRDK
jgi:hypothetical protein